MQNYRNIAVMTIIIAMIGCSSYQLQPRPRGSGWYKCPHCQGYGIVAYVGSPGGTGMLGGKSQKEMLPDNGPLDDLVYPGLAQLDGDKKKLDAYDHDDIDKKTDDMQKDLDKRNLTGDSGAGVHYKKCHTCDGIGWVK